MVYKDIIFFQKIKSVFTFIFSLEILDIFTFIKMFFFSVFSGLICGYTLYENGEILPFHMDVVNQTTGEGVILLEPNYPLQQGQSFVFEISPHDCDGKHLDR